MPRPVHNADQLPLADALLAAGRSVREVARHTHLDRGVVRRRRDALALPTFVKGPTYDFDSNVFAVDHADEHSAYWAGFMSADGCIYRSPQGGQMRVKLALAACDAAHVAAFNAWLQRSGPVLTSTARVRSGGHRFPTASVEVSSDRLAADLAEWGVVPNKTQRTGLPTWLRARNDLLPHFVRGYFDGDGHVSLHGPYETKQITRVLRLTGHGPFLADIATVLATEVHALAGLRHPQPMRSRASDAHRHVQWSAVSDLERLYTYLYVGATVWLPRKRVAFERAVTTPSLARRRR